MESVPANVRDLAALLRDPYVAGFDPVIDLVDASTQQVGREIAHILEKRHRDDLVVVYYTGHALFDDEGELHLAMHDTELDLLSPTSISASFVSAEMDRSRSKRQLLVLDCRFGSGLAHGTKGAPEARASSPSHVVAPVPDSQRLASAFRGDGRGRVILAGCDDPGRHSTVPGFRRSQVPADASDAENSPFTYHLIEGLRGAADLDRDGRITIDELYDYAFQQIAQRTGTLLPTKRGEATPGVPLAYTTRRPSVAPPAPNSSRPRVGTLISDRYLTLSVLDDTGLGIVFSARDERTGRAVTVRILRPPGSTDASTLERFMREAQVASAIDHPNVVRILELGFEGRTAFIVMEPLDGESLGALLHRKTRLPIDEALDIMLPAMAAVSAAHEMHVLHRDLNPDNIFVNRDANGGISSIKVLGFGMSTMLDEATGVPLGRGIRSPHYLSPEQLFGQGQPDLRADVYAFGVMLYEALTGQQPFAADNHAASLFKIGAGQVAPPSSICPDLPAAIDAIIDNAMALEPAQRYPDVETMRYALQNAAAAHGWATTFDSAAPPAASVSASVPAREVMIETPAVFERRRKRGVVAQSPRSWMMGVGLLAAAGGAAGWFLTGPFTDEPTRASTAAMEPLPAQQPSQQPAQAAQAPAEAPAAAARADQPQPANAAPTPAAAPGEPATPEPAKPASPTEAEVAAKPTEAASDKPAAGEPSSDTLASDKPSSDTPASEERAERRPPMPPNLAAFLADAGVPIDSVTPREARMMLIRARTEARIRARAEKRAAREERSPEGAAEDPGRAVATPSASD